MQEVNVKTILDSHQQSSNPSVMAADEYRAFSFGRVGSRTQAMLTFIKQDDYVESISYANLNRIWSSNIERQLNLDFGDRHVLIEGSNLRSLFDYICSNRCSEIVEQSGRTAMMFEKDKTLVTKLEFQRPTRRDRQA